MTTIVYDGRYIAIDSRITTNHGHISSDSFDKTYENERYVIFWSGACHTRMDFINAFIYKHDYLKDENNGLYVFDKEANKVLEIWSNEGKIKANELLYPDTTGSGADHAITALDLGCGAVEALKMAIKRDSHTGGTIRCFDTHTGKFIKVKQ